MKLRPTTKLAIQAGTAACLALAVGNIFGLERTYWAVMTSVFVLCQTWGESILKARQRLVATFGGVIAGVLLSCMIGEIAFCHVAAMAASLFLMVYYMPLNYAAATFWMTLMIILMFSMMGANEAHMAWVRIYQTFAGCAVGLLTATFVLPTRIIDSFRNDIVSILKLLQDECDKSLAFLVSGSESTSPGLKRGSAIANRLDKLRSKSRAAYHETLFPGGRRTALMLLVHQLSAIAANCCELVETCEHFRSNEIARLTTEELSSTRDLMNRRFDSLAAAMQNSKTLFAPDSAVSELRRRLREKLSPLLAGDIAQKEACLDFLGILYHLWKIFKGLEDLERAIIHDQPVSPE